MRLSSKMTMTALKTAWKKEVMIANGFGNQRSEFFMMLKVLRDK